LFFCGGGNSLRQKEKLVLSHFSCTYNPVISQIKEEEGK
jgi:hypothetical protein